MSEPDVQLHERVAVLETKVAALEQARDNRVTLDEWLIGSIIAVAGVLAVVVTALIH